MEQWGWIENLCSKLSILILYESNLLMLLESWQFLLCWFRTVAYVKSFCLSKIFTKLACTGISNFSFLETLVKFTLLSNPQFPRLYIPAWIQPIDATWFVFYCIYMSCIFPCPNQHFKIDWYLKLHYCFRIYLYPCFKIHHVCTAQYIYIYKKFININKSIVLKSVNFHIIHNWIVINWVVW